MTSTTTNDPKEVTMSTTTFSATTMAGSANEAAAKVAKYLDRLDGFEATGRVAVRSERHLLWDVEIANDGGDVDDAWVILTSYGISPSEDLGSVWQTVPGVGR